MQPAVSSMLVSVSQHEKALRAMPCIVSMTRPVTLHHCHGGSMLTLSGLPNPGMAQRANPFLQIPIHAKYHVGEFGVDTGMGPVKSVEQWEDMFGSQVSLLDEVNENLSYDLWTEALRWERENR